MVITYPNHKLQTSYEALLLNIKLGYSFKLGLLLPFNDSSKNRKDNVVA